jgi:hypothetical protein
MLAILGHPVGGGLGYVALKKQIEGIAREGIELPYLIPQRLIFCHRGITVPQLVIGLNFPRSSVEDLGKFLVESRGQLDGFTPGAFGGFTGLLGIQSWVPRKVQRRREVHSELRVYLDEFFWTHPLVTEGPLDV